MGSGVGLRPIELPPSNYLQIVLPDTFSLEDVVDKRARDEDEAWKAENGTQTAILVTVCENYDLQILAA